MSGKKKNPKKKNRNIFIMAIICCILMALLLVSLIVKLVISNMREKQDYYVPEARTEEISEAKKEDKDGYRTIGWLQVQGTNIDLPILQRLNNNFDYPVEMENYSWSLGDDDKFHNKINLFGHNIFNLGPSPKVSSDTFKRFEEVMSFVYYDFAQENKYIQMTIGDKEYIYKIFFAGFIYASDVDDFPQGDYSKDEINYQLQMFRENNLYDYDVDVSEDDDFISVITCTRFFGEFEYMDFMVTGRLVRDGEKIDNYSVKKNKNYEKVEKVLKGDGNDENVDET